MLVASPLAGDLGRPPRLAGLAVLGMLVTAVGLALMTTLRRDTRYVWPGIYMFIVGIGSGMFNSPNTAAMMGTVAPHRRGIAAGARVLVQNTGAVISIAFVLAVVTSSVPKSVLVRRLLRASRTTSPTPSSCRSSSNMHTALWCLAARLGRRRGDLRRPAQARGAADSVESSQAASRWRAGGASASREAALS